MVLFDKELNELVKASAKAAFVEIGNMSGIDHNTDPIKLIENQAAQFSKVFAKEFEPAGLLIRNEITKQISESSQ